MSVSRIYHIVNRVKSIQSQYGKIVKGATVPKALNMFSREMNLCKRIKHDTITKRIEDNYFLNHRGEKEIATDETVMFINNIKKEAYEWIDMFDTKTVLNIVEGIDEI